jgi:hypothetical protein
MNMVKKLLKLVNRRIIEFLGIIYLITLISVNRLRPVPFYSMLRGDRSGAQLHDELMAYGFCFANGLTYGGTSSAIDTYESQALRRRVGLPVNQINGKRVNLPAYLYRDDNNDSRFKRICTYFLEKVKVKVPSTPDEIFSDSFIDHLRSRVSIDTTCINNNVVIHIRRGDVNLTDHPKRYTEIDYYIDLIRQINEHSSRFNIMIHSESQNLSVDEIQKLESVGAQLHLDADLLTAWDDMIRAEILILAKSSFSYVPAILCTGTVVYTPFWHQKLHKWANNNTFDSHLENIPK